MVKSSQGLSSRPRTWFLLPLVLGLFAPTMVFSADLSKIDRRIAKEPTYKSKEPKYCLAVFGPEAKTKVWLVYDGDTLWIDRNGNGILGEKDEKVAPEKGLNPDEGYYFNAGDIPDGPFTHKIPVVSFGRLDRLASQAPAAKALLGQNPNAISYRIIAELDRPGWRGQGVGGRITCQTHYRDINGILQFGNSPLTAPIIHFLGPLQVNLFDSKPQLLAGKENKIILGVGTPGFGPGTTAWLGYEGVIPEGAFPRVEITFPPKEPNGPPIKGHFFLKERC